MVLENVESLRQYKFGFVIPFILLHLLCLGVLFFPFKWQYLVLLLVNYSVGMFFVTAAYHRYFSHRSYELNRFWQFIFAFMAQASMQKGVLWWAASHRDHHRYSDTQADIHSPVQKGFFYSHIGWILTNEHDEYEPDRIKDFYKFPELRFLDRFHWIPTTILAISMYLIGGWAWFFWGWVLTIIILAHSTFTINSLAHVWGSRRFDTADDSRNNFFLALLTLGEGWHNNHHHCMYSCRQGIRWYEVDVTYYILKSLSLIGIVKGIRPFRYGKEWTTSSSPRKRIEAAA
ncbi:MAG: fatty acid desaturase [Leptospiraceae bacterium]